MSYAPLFQSLIGGGLALAGVLITQWFVIRNERRKDEQALRDAKRERLRAIFESLISAATTMHVVTGELLLRRDDETAEQREERLNILIAKTQRDLTRSVIRAHLETEVDSAVQAMDRIFGAFKDFIADWRLRESDPSSVPAASLGTLRRNIEVDIQSLENIAQHHLTSLDHPI